MPKKQNLAIKKVLIKQYRKGNLHIREYKDKLTVHLDKVDPREDPLGHLIQDAQEVLIGLAGAALGGAAIGTYIYKMKKNSPFRKQQAVIGGLAASLATGYVSYKISKKIKGKNGLNKMDEKKTVQKTIDFIASEIRENRIQLKKLNLELQAAIKKQQELKE